MSISVTVLLEQFKALRAEIAGRSAAQSSLVQIAVTAIGALGALSFTAQDKRLLLLIPIVATVVGLMWLDHAANIFNLGDFIKDRLVPELKSAAAMQTLPDYEEFVRSYERRFHVILRSFGLPPLIVFVGVPVVAMILAFDAGTRNWVFWTLFLVDVGLVAIFLAYWWPYLTGPRSPRRPKDG